jgi:hypothetical protein
MAERFRLRASDLQDMGWPTPVYSGQKITREMLAFAQEKIKQGWKRPEERED